MGGVHAAEAKKGNDHYYCQAYRQSPDVDEITEQSQNLSMPGEALSKGLAAPVLPKRCKYRGSVKLVYVDKT